MPQAMDEETRAFLSDIEQRRGGQITFRTFSTFYADNSGKLCQYGVFFYRVNGMFWFQDFEYVPSFLGFRLTKKKDPDYQMFESWGPVLLILGTLMFGAIIGGVCISKEEEKKKEEKE